MSEQDASVASVVKNKSVTILVVEDDKFLRGLIVGRLLGEGFTVLEATDGAMGIEMAREQNPALVLLDLMLPGKDGFDVLKEIREDAGASSIPVIVLSNLSQQEDIDRAHALGAKEFLVKAQFTPSEIVEKIKAILNASYL